MEQLLPAVGSGIPSKTEGTVARSIKPFFSWDDCIDTSQIQNDLANFDRIHY